MANFLIYEERDGIVTLTMNQPELRNPLTGNTAVAEFEQAYKRIAADASVKVVVITGAGPAFCSGGNVKAMERYKADEITPLAIRDEYETGIQRLPLALYELDVPTIAAVNGAAVGAGCDLACMCDIRIAAENARFAESFIKLGIVPGDGGAWLLPRAVGMSKASEMSFTGDAITAKEALDCGLVSRVVPAERLMEEAYELASRIAANSGPALRMTKKLLREGQHMGLATLLELSASFQALAHKTPEHHEAVSAFMEKRRPRSV